MEEQGPPAEPREPGLQATPSLIETPRRISHERAAVEEIRKALAGTSEAAVFTGLGAKNRIAVPRWELTDRQFIQFGDLRVAGPRVQAVVEVESGGGVGNLVKYWPLLREAGPFREGLPFFLLHLFQLASERLHRAPEAVGFPPRSNARRPREARTHMGYHVVRGDWYLPLQRAGHRHGVARPGAQDGGRRRPSCSPIDGGGHDMSEELVFTASGSVATLAGQISFADAGLWGRRDIQEWVIANPTIIGSDVMIVTSELGDWATGRGDRDADRLDILGVSRDGNLVLVELKRDRARHTVAMEALNYAARASQFDVSKLATVHSRFSTGRGSPMTTQEAEGRLRQFAPPMTDETLQEVPRIVLMATEFGIELTTTVVFLSRKLGMDIQLIRLSAYRTEAGATLLTVSKTFPPPDMDELILFPRAEAEQERKLERTRQRNTVARLLEAKALDDGTLVRFRPRVEMAKATQEKVMAWIGEDERRGRARWRNEPGAPLIWEYDEQPYTPTGLALHLACQVGVEIGSLPGPRFWMVDGQSLSDLAREVDAE